MLSIFIGFGGTEAQIVAEKLETFLEKDTKMDVFLASPHSASLTATDHNFLAIINQKIIDCHIAVFVCHNGSQKSKPMLDELDFMVTNKLTNKVIIFSASDYCIPAKYRNKLWRPLHFTPEKPEESFCRIANEIYRSYIENIIPSKTIPENAEMPIQ